MAANVELRVYAELNDFLPPELQGLAMLRPVWPHQTVKDLIEAAGVPHTEVDLVLVDGESVGFGHRLDPGCRRAVVDVLRRFEDVGVAGDADRLTEQAFNAA